MTMSKFWQFLSDCQIMDKNLSLTDINRLLKEARLHYYEILKKMVYEKKLLLLLYYIEMNIHLLKKKRMNY